MLWLRKQQRSWSNGWHCSFLVGQWEVSFEAPLQSHNVPSFRIDGADVRKRPGRTNRPNEPQSKQSPRGWVVVVGGGVGGGVGWAVGWGGDHEGGLGFPLPKT